MAKKRQFSDNEKAAVLATLKANKDNSSKTARETGVKRQTIDKWKQGLGINDDVLQMLHVKKEELRDLHKFIAVKALGLMQNKLSECSAGQLSTIAAISTEKMLLLDNDATNITRDATPRTNEERAARILALVKSVAANRA